VQIYKSETREIVCQLREYRISRTECIAALDSALVSVVQRMKPGELSAVRFEILRNYELVSQYARKSELIGSATQDYITVQ